jgi:Reverse transcriptase (RNA-dependent DNA polymerase)/Endonuclease-reverse transcriptase
MVVVDNFRNVDGHRPLSSNDQLITETPGGHRNINLSSVIKIGTINIQHAGNSRLEQASRCLRLMNIDLAILTETKLPTFHTTDCEGYKITISVAVNSYKGGVALCVRPSRYFLVEGTATHGNNVISTYIVSGNKQWFLIGAYIPPSEHDHSTISQIELALATNRTNAPVILMGDLNINMKADWETYNDREVAIYTVLEAHSLIDVGDCFQGQRRRRDWTWCQRRNGRFIKSKVDYCMTDSREHFRFHRIKEPRLDTDHRMIVVGLQTSSKQQHRQYIIPRTKLCIQTLDNNEGDQLIKELKETIPPRPERNDHRYKSWIAESTWDLIDRKAVARRRGQRDEMERLKRMVRHALREDRKRRAQETGDYVKNLLRTRTGANIRRAYKVLGKWYRNKPTRPCIPTQEQEETIHREYQELYSAKPMPPEKISLFYDQPRVKDTIPDEEEIKAAIRKMRYNKAPGISEITAEHLRTWMREAEDTEQPRTERWDKVVKVIQNAFTSQVQPSRFNISILVRIPKDAPNEFRGIALLETLYKVITRIISDRINNTIIYHPAIHGFRRNRGTHTAISELKVHMRATMNNKKHRPRYIVFLDLTKAHDSIDRARTLEILKAYGVGPNILHFINTTWESDKVIPRQAGCYGKEFATTRGVRQGDVMSPTIFNIVIDAVVKHCERVFKTNNPNADIPKVLFYADDGVITGDDPTMVQQMLDLYCNTFLRIGLTMNARKTKSMNMVGKKPTEKKYRSNEHNGMMAKEYQAMKVRCNRCDTHVRRDYLKTHQETKKCINIHRRNQGNQHEPETADTQLNDDSDGPTINHYCISINGNMETACPVTGCMFLTTTPYNMRQHFRDRHVTDIIQIIEEGTQPLPRCPKCGIFQKDVGEKHQQTKVCQRYALRAKARQTYKQNKRMAEEVKFKVFDAEIEQVHQFKYLGRWVTDNDNDKLAKQQQHNFEKALRTWGHLHRLLSQERRRNIKLVVSVYQAIVCQQLLFGNETWILNNQQHKMLESFHRRCV